MSSVMIRRVRDDVLIDRKRFINPALLEYMAQDELILVNTVSLTSKLGDYEIKNPNSPDIDIIRMALRNAHGRKHRTLRLLMGAKMRVADVRRIFPEYKGLPKYSFAKITE